MINFWHRQGLMSVIDYADPMGILPTRNFRDTHFDKAEQINGFTMEANYKIGNTACFGCPMCCGKINLVKEGKYAGTVTELPRPKAPPCWRRLQPFEISNPPAYCEATTSATTWEWIYFHRGRYRRHH